jgi:hypothetical protein
MFDATDLELARRDHAYEMGAESPAERRWSRFYDRVEAEIVRRGWGATLDENGWEAGFSIDGASDAFSAGWSVDQYITAVIANRRSIGLNV